MLLTRSEIREAVDFFIPTSARIWTVFWDHEAVGVQSDGGVANKFIAFDEDLVVGAGVNGLVEIVFVQVIVNMLMTTSSHGQECEVWKKGRLSQDSPESPSRTSCPAIFPVVVVVSDMEMAKVDITEDIGISYEGYFPVVVEVVVGDGDPVACADDVELSILYRKTNFINFILS